MARKMTKHAKAAMANAAPRVAKAAAMVNVEKVVVMVAVVVAMAAVVNAAKVHKEKSAHHAKVVAVARAEVRAVPKVAMNCAKAKPAPHVANALSVVSARSALPVTVLPVKAVAMVVAKTAMKAETKAAAMQHLS